MRKSLSNTTVILILCSIVLLTLNILRVCKVSITHDEAVTYSDFILAPYRNILLCDPPTANNHILNTLAGKIFSQLFNTRALLVLRLGSILAHCIYLLYSAKLALRLADKPVSVIAVFLLLNLNTYQFDFFALMRGYALSWAFMIMSVYYLVAYLQEGKLYQLLLSLLGSVLAVYANLTLINYFVALSAVLLLNAFANKQQRIQLITSLVFTCLGLYFMVGQVVATLKKADQFYYGGDEGLMADTISSIIKRTFVINLDNISRIGVYVFVFIIALVGVYCLYTILRKKNRYNLLMFSLWLLLVLVLVSVQMQHWLLGSKFIIGRTAIFIYPLFIIPVVHMLSQLKNPYYFGPALLYVSVVGMLVCFIKNFSFRKTYDWEYDSPSAAIMDYMKDHAKRNGTLISVRPFWMYAPAMNYMAANVYDNIFAPVVRNMDLPTADTTYDYYYMPQSHISYLSPRYTIDTIIYLSEEPVVLLSKK